MKIENQLSIFIFHFLILKKMEIKPRFSFFIFQLSEKMNDLNIHALNGYSSEILNQTPKGDQSGRGPTFF